jgi:hypothetical protein
MTDYLIFNHHSVPYKSLEDAQEEFPIFINILSEAFKEGLSAIRLSEQDVDKGWFEIQLSSGYTIREWLEGQEIDWKRKVESLIENTKFPIIPKEELEISEKHEWSGFSLKADEKIQVPVLGATYLLQKTAVSLASASCWLPNKIEIYQEVIEEENVKKYLYTANNVATEQDFKDYLLDFKKEQKESLRKGGELWDKKATLFPNLIFCGDTKSQLTNLSISDKVYNQLYHSLTQLNAYCKKSEDYSLTSIQKSTELRITDESDTVKQNPYLRRPRVFAVNGKKEFFGYHIKNFSGAMRLHFFSVREEKKIYVGYFGKHLPTAKNK